MTNRRSTVPQRATRVCWRFIHHFTRSITGSKPTRDRVFFWIKDEPWPSGRSTSEVASGADLRVDRTSAIFAGVRRNVVLRRAARRLRAVHVARVPPLDVRCRTFQTMHARIVHVWWSARMFAGPKQNGTLRWCRRVHARAHGTSNRPAQARDVRHQVQP